MADYRWVPVSPGHSHISSNGFTAGVDLGGAEIIAGRAFHEGDLIPAKVIPAKNECYVSYNGGEILKNEYEVLVPDGATFSWQESSRGEVPVGAIVAGRTASGEDLYYGRVFHDGCITPGKIHQSHAVCYYPYDGEERQASEYEVLVR